MPAINSSDVRDKNPYKSVNDEMNSYIMHGKLKNESTLLPRSQYVVSLLNMSVIDARKSSSGWRWKFHLIRLRSLQVE